MRTIISLNGKWQIAEGSDPVVPGAFARTIPVPGLVSLATPPFAAASILDRTPPAKQERYGPIADPRRDYFWYRHEFEVATTGGNARLRIAKAQFGLKAWINGHELGEHFPCFSSAVFDVTPFLRQGRNEILLRIGAHPAIVPPTIPVGSDQEKNIWLPGVYDDVALWISDNPVITSLQVAPDIHQKCARIRATVRNTGSTSVTFKPTALICEAATARECARWEGTTIVLKPNAETIVESAVPLANPHLWSPDDPFLYRLNFSTGGDSQSVRFGMREFRFDTATRRAYLNDKLVFLRGSTITLHRFFEDPLCQGHPWDPAWVRKLLADWPRKLGWNSFRFSIGPVPDFWLDIADEAGLLIENEFFMWGRRTTWDANLIQDHAAQWMADCWNHPSVAWWSLSNETWGVDLNDMIGMLRQHDLSDRAWSNGYYLPPGPNDPVDDHHYLHYDKESPDGPPWVLDRFTNTTAGKSVNSPHPSAHATVLNEYGWHWLRRNGQPTALTRNTFALFLPAGASEAEHIRFAAEINSHETRYFRSHRNYAGVLHFNFLTADHDYVFTGDLWKDVATLTMWPEYEEAFTNAFQPVCVHIHYFQKAKPSGDSEFVPVMLINDSDAPVGGEITVSIVDSKQQVFSQYRLPWNLPAYGQHTWFLHPEFPVAVGQYRVVAEATWDTGRKVRCSSRLEITAPKSVPNR